MPYEAIYEDEYSTKSDVYSFGVIIWEVFSQGELPLSKLSDSTVLTQLKEKQLQWKTHKNTPAELQKLQVSYFIYNEVFVVYNEFFYFVHRSHVWQRVRKIVHISPRLYKHYQIS